MSPVIEPIALGDFGQALEPPVFGELAAALAHDLAPLHDALERAHGALLAETLLDLTGGDDGGLAELSEATTTDDADELPLDDLLAAQAGFEDVRTTLAIFAATFPAGDVPGVVVVDRRNPQPRPPSAPGGPHPV